MHRISRPVLARFLLALATLLISGATAHDHVGSVHAAGSCRPTTSACPSSGAGTPSQSALLAQEASNLAPSMALAAHGGPTAPVSLSVVAGYDDQYRTSAWVPIRITARNRTSNLLQGVCAVPGRTDTAQFASPGYSSVYQVPIVLPAGASKTVTLYMPGQSVGDYVNTQFIVAGKVVASRSATPSSFDDQAVTVGILTRDPLLTAWVHHVASPLLGGSSSTVNTVALDLATVDPVADALANFDAIVVSNVDSSRLHADQVAALQQYVRNGGGLILVGGPDWQESLQPLPPSLVPGYLDGARVLPDLTRLSGMQTSSGMPASRGVSGRKGITPPVVPRGNGTIVSVLTHPRGTVLADEAGTPLVVREMVGKGRIVYLAFDPAIDPFPRRPGAAAMLSDLVAQATTQAASRLSSAGGQASFGFFRDRYGPSIMRQELANLPSGTRPSLLLLIILTLASLVLVGPLNFLVLHRLGWREWTLVTTPLLGLLCLGSTLALTLHVKGSVAVLNTVGVVELDGCQDGRCAVGAWNGSSAGRPATLYVGLFAPLRGEYHIVWNAPSMPQGLPSYSLNSGLPVSAIPLGARLGEGGSTAIDFPSMTMWSTRSAALETTVPVAGQIRGNLSLASDGSIVGRVRNDTDLALFRPALIAGGSVLRLPDLPPHAWLSVRLHPSVLIVWNRPSSLWDQVYASATGGGSQSDLSQFGLSQTGLFATWDGDPWEEPPAAVERSPMDRLRNVAERLPAARDTTGAGQVLFVGWNDRPLGTFSIDGAQPQRRDLNLIVASLSVRFPHTGFRLRPGTLSASLIDYRLNQSQTGCCFDLSGQSTIDLGAGSWATFEFDIPHARTLHFRRLTLAVDPGGANESNIGQIYDWHAARWVHVPIQLDGTSLGSPDRFVSPSGALLVRLSATTDSGDIVITDPAKSLQVSGWATTR